MLVAAPTGKAQLIPSPAPDSGPAAAPNVGPFEISGRIDGYYSLGFNHPANNGNGLRNFDDKANQIELNMASMTLDYSPQPVGFHLDVGVGRAFDIMSATEKDATGMRFFEQVYVEVKPPAWTGLELDFGKFSSWASAEVIETPNNWNYSRSLLFVWCTPFNHFGFRATKPLGPHFTTGFAIVSGWNNILTGATFKTMGWTGSWTPTSRVTWTNTWYGGPDENAANRGLRNLYDSLLLLSPSSRTSFYINLDYLHDRPKFTPGYSVYGIAGAAKFQLSRKLSLSPRLEWLNDNTGMATGTGQHVKEFTLTGRYALLDGLSAWLEMRNDWSNRPFFNRGNETASAKNQPTLLLGMAAVIGPKR